jgi:acetolactate synthase-1/2/3 large subunit
VLVDITKDAQQGACDAFEWEEAASRADALLHDPKARPARSGRPSGLPDEGPDEAILREAADAIASARRPIILAGHGILIAGASSLLREFAERTGIPVATTLLGIGAMRGSHPLNLGMLGMHGEAFANEAVQRADLIIALGMRFDDRAVGRVSEFAPNARRIHVDIDRAEINKTVRADIGIVGDAGEVLQVLRRDVPACDRTDWLGEIQAARRHAGARDILNLPTTAACTRHT